MMTHLQQNEKIFKSMKMSESFSDWAAKEIKTLEKQITALTKERDELQFSFDAQCNSADKLFDQLAAAQATIAKQRDELLAALEKERVSHAATGHAMGGKCQELFLENRELQKDAGRYQWILQQAKITDFIFAYTKSDERHVSNAIDAAIAKVKP